MKDCVFKEELELRVTSLRLMLSAFCTRLSDILANDAVVA